ncbi:MAG: alpha/beta hydrolase family esterase [Alphaproteobacteria bacterium]
MAGIAGVLLLATGLAAARGEAFLHNGVVRSYELVVPPGLALPAPALVLLHGGGGSGRQLRDHIGFEDFAAEAGVIGVFPDSVERLWNDGRTSPDLADAQARAGDDAGFIVALVDALAAAGVVDAGRVGVGGISNGGMMTLRLACVAPGRFVAFAVVAANMAVGIECPQGPPAPMLFVHGSEDPIIRYGGGPIIIPLAPGRVRGTALPVPETLAIWAQRNGCGSPPALHARLDLRPFDGTAVAIYDYPGCRANLRHILIEGGGHAWPGARQRLLGLLSGRTSREIDATVAIWAFVTAQSSR